MNNLFTLAFDENFSQFANDVKSQVSMYSKVKGLFDESGTTQVKISKISSGSVVVAFGLYDSQMDERTQTGCVGVQAYKNKLFDAEGNIKTDFAAKCAPYKLLEASFTPQKACIDVIQPAQDKWEVTAPVPGGSVSQDNTVLYVIIPLTVVVVVVIIVIVVAVVCIRHRRQDSRNVSKSNGTYIEAGVPVVMEGELQTISKSQTAETEPLMQQTSKPPAYPHNGTVTETTPLASNAETDNLPPTPPLSESDDTQS
ncbi:hypothetical protein EB796_011674 [Bugula neritina]|uniref:Dystroglycan C-terminal domain-containing protein n=1 Tax=Bugula neritina TaxID=10212 RepID=A0A7J7JUG7_BUGNE|nr:hypothetical protein EB796_011674 [Bugula neritina]